MSAADFGFRVVCDALDIHLLALDGLGEDTTTPPKNDVRKVLEEVINWELCQYIFHHDIYSAKEVMMPGTWNGIGTTYYGAKDRYPDKSFATTEWFVVLSVPLIPIRSLRVMLIEKSTGFRRSSQRYLIIQKLPLDFQQVFATYFIGFISIVSGIWLASIIYQALPNSEWQMPLATLGFFAPYIISMFLFFKAE